MSREAEVRHVRPLPPSKRQMLHQSIAAATRSNWRQSRSAEFATIPGSSRPRGTRRHRNLLRPQRGPLRRGRNRPNTSTRSFCGAVAAQAARATGRRQIGVFHLPGDMFGLEPDADTSAVLPKRSSKRLSAWLSAAALGFGKVRRPSRLRAVDDDRRRSASRGRSHAAARPQDCSGTRRDVPARDGSPALQGRHVCAADGRGDIATISA